MTLWFMDEAGFGQKGRVCHRWFTRGQRPPGLCDQRYSWTHLFAAVRPATGEGFALVLPEVSAKAMNEFLAQFAATLPANEHAVMVLDRAGWHTAKRLVIPSNVTLVWLPPYSPQPSGQCPEAGGTGLAVSAREALEPPPARHQWRHRRRPLPGMECTHRRAPPNPHQLPLP